MLIYNKENHNIYNLDNADTISITAGNHYYYILMETSTSSYTICEDADKELLEKVLTDIYIHMTYGNGNYILDLNEFKERKDEKNTDTI